MNARTREHLSFARNLLRDALQLAQGRAPACAPRHEELVATYKTLLQARDEIAHALAHMQVHDREAVLDALSTTAAAQPSQSSSRRSLGEGSPECTHAQVDDYARRLHASCGGDPDEALVDVFADIPPTVHETPEPFRGVETPCPSPIAPRPAARPRGRYTWSHQARQLIAVSGTVSSPGRKSA